MPEAARVIRIVDGQPQIVADDWCLVEGDEQWDACTAGQRPLLPLALARSQAARACAASGWGLWLAPDDDPALAVDFFPHLALIGVQFPRFTDGRGYSTAVLLRTRHGWRGELRALGDVLQDQLYALRRVGFDSFALRAGRDPQAALRGFTPFSDAYQGSVDQPLPAFRRSGAAS
jgi:uncharacterized protein (DUF934 family)